MDGVCLSWVVERSLYFEVPSGSVSSGVREAPSGPYTMTLVTVGGTRKTREDCDRYVDPRYSSCLRVSPFG